MAVWNRDLIVQKIDKVLGDTKQILTALSGGTAGVASGDNKAKQLILEALGDKPGIDIPITLIVREE